MAEGTENPFRGFSDTMSELNRMWQLGRTGQDPAHHEARERDHATAWVPAADIFARGEDLVIRIELAGMDPGDIDVSFSRGVLTVTGERRTHEGAEGATFYVRERYFGAFRRSMNLPEGTAEEAITAEFENGLVEITVRGGAGGSGPRRIALVDRSGARTARALS